jgi:hypothetical protein
METSQSITKIATALKDFQADIPAVGRHGLNPHFRSKYATLDDLITAIRKPLSKCGLSFAQFPTGDNELCTMVMHTSGEWIRATAKMQPVKNDPQAQGSAITYMRRYALGAALGIATDEDDDANAATQQKKEPMKSYAVQRRVPAADDEAGGAVIQTEVDVDAQKKTIVRLLKALAKPTKTAKQCADAVFDLTDLALEEKSYETIIDRLEALADERKAK